MRFSALENLSPQIPIIYEETLIFCTRVYTIYIFINRIKCELNLSVFLSNRKWCVESGKNEVSFVFTSFRSTFALKVFGISFWASLLRDFSLWLRPVSVSLCIESVFDPNRTATYCISGSLNDYVQYRTNTRKQVLIVRMSVNLGRLTSFDKAPSGRVELYRYTVYLFFFNFTYNFTLNLVEKIKQNYCL